MISASFLAFLMPAAVGEMPIPDFSLFQSDVSVDVSESEEGYYVYRYEIRNPESNTGSIAHWSLSTEVPYPHAWPTGRSELTIGSGEDQRPFAEALDWLRQYNDRDPMKMMTPISVSPGESWWVDVDTSGVSFQAVSSRRPQPGGDPVEIEVRSPSPPALRPLTVMPHWVHVADESEIEEHEQQVTQIFQELEQQVVTVGPFGVRPNSGVYIERFKEDLIRMSELDWCESSFVDQIRTGVKSIEESIRHGEYAARGELEAVIDRVSASRDSCVNSQGYQLIYLGLTSMLDQLPTELPPEPPPPPPEEPVYEIVDHPQSLNAGEVFDLEVVVTDSGRDDQPIEGETLLVRVVDGPNRDTGGFVSTDSEGIASFGYRGYSAGIDEIVVERALFGLEGQVSQEQPAIAETRARWLKGSDLLVSHFIPPFIRWDGSSEIRFDDVTENRGPVPVGATTTRYLISKNEEFDGDVYVVGERRVEPLSAYDHDDGEALWLSLPDHLSPGDYYLKACADAEDEVIEHDEANNCATNSRATPAAPDGASGDRSGGAVMMRGQPTGR